MNQEFHERVQQIMEAAFRLMPGERADFLNRACGTDEVLAREARSLLPHYEATREFEPSRSKEWLLPGTTTINRAAVEAEEAQATEPTPPFCIDQYRCDELLGRGGMGVVYRAVHATLRRDFAIKLLRPGLLNAENRWRFAFEGELLRRLQHPGIVRILHVSELRTTRGFQPYLVMEYIRGRSLIRYAEECGLNALERLRLFVKVCEAAEYAHRRGIVHRDLKPGNILVEDSAQPKILDFGVAHIQEYDSMPSSAVQGRFVGTFDYASPEQLTGKNDRLTPACDVYALALVLHELLAGSLPAVRGGRVRLALDRLQIEGSPRAVVQHPNEFRYYLRILFTRGLARQPESRFRTGGELGDAVAAVVAEFDRPSGWKRVRERLRRIFTRTSTEGAHEQNRPLAAVLRTRLSLSLDVDSASAKAEEVQARVEDSESDVYRLRDEEPGDSEMSTKS